MPQLTLSTILGAALAIFVGLQQAFPNQQWIGAVAAALALIVAPEKHPPPAK